jgi:glycosyltransferase involved in cell wall biosynthesis
MADDVRAVAIVHFTESLATGVLGVVRELANDSAARGIPTTVVHGRRPQTPADVRPLFHPDVRLVEVPSFGGRSVRGALAIARAGVVLRRELAKAGGGILHIHSTFAGVVGRLVNPRRRWQTFYTPQGYAFLNPAHPIAVRGAARALERLLGQRVTTLASSDTEAAVARDELGLRRVDVVRNGIRADDRWERPVRSSGGVARVVSVGRAAPQRRPELYAQIAARFRGRADVAFEWVGEGALRPELERGGVAVTGWVMPDDVAEYLAEADIVLHLATFEGLPLALLEAMRGGRAIVASDLPVLREVGEGVVEFVDDVDSGVAAVERLIADPDLRARLGDAAAGRVRERYSVEAMTRAAYRAYGLEKAIE